MSVVNSDFTRHKVLHLEFRMKTTQRMNQKQCVGREGGYQRGCRTSCRTDPSTTAFEPGTGPFHI